MPAVAGPGVSGFCGRLIGAPRSESIYRQARRAIRVLVPLIRLHAYDPPAPPQACKYPVGARTNTRFPVDGANMTSGKGISGSWPPLTQGSSILRRHELLVACQHQDLRATAPNMATSAGSPSWVVLGRH